MKLKHMREIIEVAKGEREADLIIADGEILNLFTGKTEKKSIAVKNGIIAGIGDYKRGKEIYDCKGKIVVPGFIDAHIHIESSHLIPSYFGEAAAKHGTTTVVADPHEIANAASMEGIDFFIKNAGKSPIDIFFTASSCVPAIKFWDAYKNEITPSDIEKLLKRKNVIGLAEMMNFPGVVNGDKEVLEKLSKAKKMFKDGHAPLLSGKNLNAYLSTGISADHECTDIEEAKEKLFKGMFVMIRQGSAAKNLYLLPEILKIPYAIDRIALVSDDLLPTHLVTYGHLNRILKEAYTEFKIEPAILIRLITLNPANFLGMNDRGIIAPGKKADITIFENTVDFNVLAVFKNGEKIFVKGEKEKQKKSVKIPENLKHTVNLPKVKQEDFILKCDKPKIKAIKIIPNQILTEEIEITPEREGENIIASIERDFAKLTVFDRYSGKKNKSTAIVTGFGIKRGAIASTYLHDTHNLAVLGIDEKDMEIAANEVISAGGGMAVALNGKIIASLPLSVGGVASGFNAEKTAEKYHILLKEALKLGFIVEEPFTVLSFLSLTVIPELKLTPEGLVNLTKNRKNGMLTEETWQKT